MKVLQTEMMSITVNLVLDLLREKVMIKEAPTSLIIKNGSNIRMLIAPLIDYMKRLGQPLEN
jgi:hypothetical protein